VHFTETSKNIL